MKIVSQIYLKMFWIIFFFLTNKLIWYFLLFKLMKRFKYFLQSFLKKSLTLCTIRNTIYMYVYISPLFTPLYPFSRKKKKNILMLSEISYKNKVRRFY